MIPVELFNYCDGDNLIEQEWTIDTDAAEPGWLEVQYVHAPDGEVICRDRLFDDDTSDRVWALEDGQGSTSALLGGTGQVIERFVYDADGRPVAVDADRNGYHEDTADDLLLGADHRSSRQDWEFLHGGQRWVGLFFHDHDPVSSNVGLYEAGPGQWMNAGTGRLLAPSVVASTGGNAYDPRMDAYTGSEGWGVKALGWTGVALIALSGGPGALAFLAGGALVGALGGALIADYNDWDIATGAEVGATIGSFVGGFPGLLRVGGAKFLQYGDEGLVGAQNLVWRLGGGGPNLAGALVSGGTRTAMMAGEGAIGAGAFAGGNVNWGGLLGNAVFQVRNALHSDLLSSGAIREVTDYEAGVFANVTEHHIASNKSGQYTPFFDQLFRGASTPSRAFTLEHHLNKVRIPGHLGPHGDAYNWIIYDRLRLGVAGLLPGSTQYRWALRSALKRLATEIRDPNNVLNQMVRFPA